MKHTKHSRQILKGFSVLSNTLWISVLVSAIFLFLHANTFAQQMEEKDYRITLQSRTFTPQPGIKSSLQDSLVVQLEREEKRHVYLQLKKHISFKERSEMEKQGIKLLSYIGSYTWYATITEQRALNFTIPDSVSRMPILGTMRWIGEIKPEDRIVPDILKAGADTRIKTEDNRERYSIYFFRDVSMDAARRIITSLGGEIKGEEKLTRGFFVVLLPDTRNSLINKDGVKLIDFYPPPDIDFNDGSRTWCHTDVVHGLGLTGNGVILGQWESGIPRNTHVDLTAPRSHWGEPATVKKHATHVCGTMIGTGTGNAAFMGHTPSVGVDVFSYTSTDASDEMAISIGSDGIVAANNSWGKAVGWVGNTFGPYYNQTYFGDYRWSCPAFDELVSDSGLVIVFSAGNDRNDPTGGIETNAQPGDWDQIAGAGLDSWDGYHTIPPYGTAKNVITVGAINDATGAMAVFSNWGPTDDGRIKPDLVAPGVDIVSCHYQDTDVDGTYNDYVPLADHYSGTSMAAPAVTGIVALLIQSYRDEYLDTPTSPLTPLPSTIKALLCQSAQDMGDPGPDYQFGYGGVRADAARQLILDKRFREGVMLAMTDQDIYNFQVTAGDPEIRITLAWDDHPAGAGNPNPTIINDLDLVIQDPAGNYYTPWHLHITAHNQAINPATRNSHSVASTNLIPGADRDRWNNVEQVYIDPILTGGPLAGGNWKVIVEANLLPEAPQHYSLVGNYTFEGEVDVIQVLDRSGSMGGLTSSSSTDTKIEVLRDAAQQFVDIMKPDIGNRLGLVQFNHNIVNFDPSHDANLSELTGTRVPTIRDVAVPSIVHGGATSIGDGLYEALSQFTSLPDPNSDQVVLLVTDGKENSARMISNVQPNLINNQIAVYPLGLGYGSGINEDKLTNLAKATGGTYRITSDDLIFRKWFIEILAGAVNWSVITDPILEIATNETDTIPVTITADQVGATFTAYWEGKNEAIDLEVIAPSGIVISSATRNTSIRYGEHPRYAFYQLDFPLSNSLASEWAGEWKMKLSGTDRIPIGQKVRCSASAFGEGGVELEVSIDKLYHLTGDNVQVKARLVNRNQAVVDANLDVYCNIPLVGAGNILHKGKVNLDDLNKNRVVFGDTLSLIDNKLKILAEQAGKDIFQRDKTTFKLFDDGQHNDGKENDGVYANSFAATKVQGSYTFRFVASNIPTISGQKITREWTQSFYNEVNIDPKYSVIELKLIGRAIGPDLDGWNYTVKVAPRDKYNNYRGPGRPVLVSITHKDGSRQITLNDNIDGTYTKDIYISQRELDQGAKLLVEIDGKTFTTIEKLPTYPKWALSIHSGTAVPTGTLANNFDQGLNMLFDLEYRLIQQLSLVGYFGYNDFKSKTTGIDDNYWINLSLNLKYRRPLPLLPTSALYYYIQAGPGYYIPKTGDSGLGANFGVGFNYDVSSSLTFEAGTDYHTVFDKDVKFWHAHAGIIFRF